MKDSSTGSDDGNNGDDNNNNNNNESLEDLARYDPSLAYSQAAMPVLSHYWNVLCRMIPHPIVLVLLLSLILGGVLYGNTYIRVSIFVSFALLPLIGITLVTVKGTRMFVNSRRPSFPSAQNILLERLQTGRAKRIKDKYDLFLPSVHELPNANTKQIGIIFFPGALVHHTSYAPIASQLSDHGIVVVVMSLEPMRFITDTNVTKKMALDVISTMSSGDDDDLTTIDVDEWVLAGHSAGATTAMNLAVEMNKEKQPAGPGNISKLVMCGIGSNSSMDGKENLRYASVQALVVNGSEDKLVTRYSEELVKVFHDLLPPTSSGGNGKGKTTYITIEGGNHAGFGHYGPQKGDGMRTIPLEAQQSIFVEKTVEFSLSGNDDEETKKEN